jgi:hypothetical protein
MRLGVEACWTMSRPARRPGRPADPGAPGTRRPPTKKAPSTQIHTSDWGLRCGYHSQGHLGAARSGSPRLRRVARRFIDRLATACRRGASPARMGRLTPAVKGG